MSAAQTNIAVTTYDNTNAAAVNPTASILNDDLQTILLSYTDLGKKLMQCVDPSVTNPASPQFAATRVGASRDLKVESGPNGNHQQQYEQFVPIRELSFLPRREFKIQGGQIGDDSSDISYSNMSRQIDKGIQNNFADSDIVQAMLKIIKPGNFKDMLINKGDMKVTELKGFLQSHLRKKNSAELFQELICTKQLDSETPQQFLYRVMGLKQRIMFTSNLPDASIKYSKATVQDVFLHTVYQGLGHKHNDIRRELKSLLAEPDVKDEKILRHVMRITSEENERRQRLGPVPHQNLATVCSAQFDTDTPLEQQAAHQRSKSVVDTDIINQLTSRIDALTQMVASLKQGARAQQFEQACQCSQRRIGQVRRQRANSCPTCVENGSSNCNHCFFCGVEGHSAVGCLKRLQQQENYSRSLEKGQPVTGVQPQPKTTSSLQDTPVSTAGVTKRPSQRKENSANLSQDSVIKKNEQVARLIERKGLIQCYLNGLDVNALLDTGAQVSMIDCTWKNKHLPNIDIQPLDY
ncbi:uncharacterized protein LOC107834634 [Poecilia formosa]|uniref:uncharacterized protein LOC107834634 n=1 Tax=Poecilia formosa TaxID=48698 RepID=UPI0007B87E08|nr:PREDICTED: uncharacterized protein LOC107834634 [Poecilia formosa]